VSLVLDTSATLAWLYQDENGDLAREILDRVTSGGAWVPAIWRLEIANGLRTGIRRGRIDMNYRDEALSNLGLLNISIDSETDKHAWTTTLRLSDRFQLTPYDAAYLELAQRRSLPLASLDSELVAVAQELALPVIGA
jgi:predicted nucleic acid-binding protein